VQQVAGIVSEIAEASREQATGIDEINTAITQMDEVTQQNAALVEQNTAAAQSMVEQARELEKLMSFFKLKDGDEEGADSESSYRPKLASVNNNKMPVKKPPFPGAKKSAASIMKPAKSAGDKKGYDADWKEF
jgi:methyl-accepting chemotaxis protein